MRDAVDLNMPMHSAIKLVYTQYFDFDDCTEEEFMEAWEQGLKSMSLKQSITEKNILSCQIY
jgi:hypothetical protein